MFNGSMTGGTVSAITVNIPKTLVCPCTNPFFHWLLTGLGIVVVQLNNQDFIPESGGILSAQYSGCNYGGQE
jgi:hypothetical protein